MNTNGIRNDALLARSQLPHGWEELILRMCDEIDKLRLSELENDR